MGLHNAVHNGEPQPRTASGARSALIGPPEALEKVGLKLFRDSWAAVGNGKRHGVASRGEPDIDVGAFWRVNGGVLDQIGHHLHHLVAIRVD